MRRDRVRATKQHLEDDSITKFQKLRTATKYKRLSKETYYVIKVNLYRSETIPALSFYPLAL